MSKPLSYLGVDLGSGGAKLAEISDENGRARLVNYAYTNIGALGGWLKDPKASAGLLKKILAKARIKTRISVAGIPVQDVFSSIVTLPKTGKDELRIAVGAQVEKLTGKKVSELVIDWKDIVPEAGSEKPEEGSSKLGNFLVTAVDKTVVQGYSEIFALAGLKLTSLETESFALIRSVIGKDKATVLIIDVGNHRTNLFVARGGLPILSRSIKSGGDAITEALANRMGISREEAEKLKQDATLIGQFGEGDSFPELFATALQPLTDEIKYFLDTYLKTNGEVGRIDRVVLTGGTAKLAKLTDYLARAFNLRVFLGDPWARVLYPDALRPILDDLGSRFAVAIGLAMHEIEE